MVIGPHVSPAFPQSLLTELGRQVADLDGLDRWPRQALDQLAAVGGMRWAVPREFGGEGLPALPQHLAYESLARASVAMSLILSQRDAAVGLIATSESPIRGEWLRRLAAGRAFATVGIAQLTTSRQGAAPALRAIRVPGGYELDGLIPWCTGAAEADAIVAGAVDDEGLQLLALLPADTPGVRVDPPMPLVALRPTLTASVRCVRAAIPDSHILRTGDRVLARDNQLPLGQTFIATGLCRGALDLIAEYRSPAGQRALDRLDAQLEHLRRDVLDLSQPGREADANHSAPALRGRCNDLALRTTHTAVTLYKGTGLLAGHPAQRLAREALFLLVWSCPNPVIDCTVDLLTRPPAPEPGA